LFFINVKSYFLKHLFYYFTLEHHLSSLFFVERIVQFIKNYWAVAVFSAEAINGWYCLTSVVCIYHRMSLSHIPIFV